MEQKIEKILKQLKSISPSESFLARSKVEIFMQSQRQPFLPPLRALIFENIRLTAALGLATVFLFVGFGIASYFQDGNSPFLGSFNNKNLLVEANSLNFQTQIREATYFSESAKAVAVALDEISKEKTNE